LFFSVLTSRKTSFFLSFSTDNARAERGRQSHVWQSFLFLHILIECLGICNRAKAIFGFLAVLELMLFCVLTKVAKLLRSTDSGTLAVKYALVQQTEFLCNKVILCDDAV
jgi:hypothetical protein